MDSVVPDAGGYVAVWWRVRVDDAAVVRQRRNGRRLEGRRLPQHRLVVTAGIEIMQRVVAREAVADEGATSARNASGHGGQLPSVGGIAPGSSSSDEFDLEGID